MSMDNPDALKNRPVKDWGPSRTSQSEEAGANINNMVRRHNLKVNELTHVATTLGEFRDISDLPDLQTAMNIVADANSAFQELPGEVRHLMDHNVGNFLPFIDDPENLDQCIELGLLPAPEGYRKPVPSARDPITNSVPNPQEEEETPPE